MSLNSTLTDIIARLRQGRFACGCHSERSERITFTTETQSPRRTNHGRQDRRVYKLDLFERPPAEAADILRRYLANERVVSGEALDTARKEYRSRNRRIRSDWGFPDPANMAMLDRFTTKYRGRRYSFGYPACPALEDHARIWKLLRPEEIGVQLTEGFMMDPEASVSALVFHHPDCTYFGVGEGSE